jgi:ribosome-binding ATPase YchF (GTP1/OBG family)
MENPDDKKLFMDEYKMKEPSWTIDIPLITSKLFTYFTAGVQEVRAWTITRDEGAAGCQVIHTDFEKGFIKAEVISYDDYVQYGFLLKRA